MEISLYLSYRSAKPAVLANKQGDHSSKTDYEVVDYDIQPPVS